MGVRKTPFSLLDAGLADGVSTAVINIRNMLGFVLASVLLSPKLLLQRLA